MSAEQPATAAGPTLDERLRDRVATILASVCRQGHACSVSLPARSHYEAADALIAEGLIRNAR